jgi:hypothetical protein
MSARYENTITAESVPVYGYWGLGWISPYWESDDWIVWHKKLVANMGLNEANKKFITAIYAAPMFAASYGFRTVEPNFVSYAKESGFYNALFQGIAGLVGYVESTVANSGQAIADTTDAFKKFFDSLLKYLLPIL